MMKDNLKKILSYCRSHGSKGEAAFIRDIIKPHGFASMRNGAGEVMAFMHEMRPEQDSKILWCCHIDTMHALDAPERQKIEFDEDTGLIYKTDGIPLGADDGAGVWLLLEMIRCGVPGTYLFHRGEERGGIGSNYISQHHSAWLKTFKYAVAFDRRGSDSVITEQMVGECASNEFAVSMAKVLNKHGKYMDFKPDDTGTFTDTANYADDVPECTNISVGYENEHSHRELLDVDYLLHLRDAVITAFGHGYKGEEKLVCKREAGDYGYQRYGRYSGGVIDLFDWKDFRDNYPTSSKHGTPQYDTATDTANELMQALLDARLQDAYNQLSLEQVREIAADNPRAVTDMIESIYSMEYSVEDQDVLVQDLLSWEEDTNVRGFPTT